MNNVVNKCIKVVGCCLSGVIYLFNRIVACCNKGESQSRTKGSIGGAYDTSIFDRGINEVELKSLLEEGDRWIEKMEQVLEDAIANPQFKIILIGNMHTEKSQEFEVKVMEKAIHKKIIAVQESLSNTPDAVLKRVQVLKYNEVGYLFGMEDPLVNHFADLVYRYGPLYVSIIRQDCVNKIISEKAEDAKIEVLGQLYLEPICRKLWKSFIASGDSKNLSQEVIVTIDVMLKGNSLKAIWQAYDRLSKDQYQWVELFRYYAGYVLKNDIAELAEEKRPNIQVIEKYLLDPLDEKAICYVEYDLNVNWRGIFIKENMRKTVECVKDLDKPLITIIGQNHFHDLENFFRSEGLPMDSYSFEHGITEKDVREYIHNNSSW